MSKLTHLGLDEDAAPEEMEARYAELTAFLRSAAVPASLRPWAQQQLAILDDYYASGESREWEAPPRAAKARPNGARQQQQTAARGKRPAAQSRGARRAKEVRLALPQGSLGRVLAGLVAAVAITAAVAGFFYVRGGGDDDSLATAPSADQFEALDEGRVAELKAIVAQQPDNQDALFELGERYFSAGQYEPAIEWFTKLVALNPNDTHALTDIGTANFNLGSPQEAKTYWERVLQVDANDVQAHYNLGFYYANVEPRDMESAVREWEAVISLDPNSPQAQTARVHIEGLRAEPTPQAPVAP